MSEIETMMTLRYEAEQFLYREAMLFDEQRYTEWLDTVTDDIFYWAPAVESVEYQRETRNQDHGETGMAYFQDSKATLKMRADRLLVGGAWAEIPPSRMVHYISNVLIEGVEGDEILVRSNFFLFRSRLEAEEDTYYGARQDRLRRVDGSLKLARRKIVLAQAVLKSRSITTLF